MSNYDMERERPAAPRVVVVGLASCFGCQLQVTNAEPYLLDVLGQIDLRYWQLTSSDPMPDDFDVAVIEGAATTKEAVDTLKRVRKVAKKVIAIGSCATTAGIPGMAATGLGSHVASVYGDAGAPEACGDMIDPAPISDFIDVDFEVLCCPIDTFAFIDVLQCAIYGSNRLPQTSTLCGECKYNDRGCFFGRGVLCLGLVTRSGCGARCTDLGRPCNGCAGLSPDANVASARKACERAGVSVRAFDEALTLFNQVNPAICAENEG